MNTFSEADEALEYDYKYLNTSWLSNTTFLMENYSNYFDVPLETVNGLVEIVVTLNTYCVPIILSIGMILNISFVVTIRMSDLKNVPACFCFMSLGIIDTVYLIAMWIPWLSKMTVDIYNSKGFCQLTYYLNILTAFLSSWYIVIILIERLRATYSPNRPSKFFSAFRTKCYVTIFSIFSIVAHLYLTWTSGVYTFNKTSHCMVILDHWYDILIMRKIDIFFSFLLPVTICAVMSIAIVTIMNFGKVNNSDNGFQKQPTPSDVVELRIIGSINRCKYSNIPQKPKQERRQVVRQTSRSWRLTCSGLTIAVMYIVLTAPHNILKTKITFENKNNEVTLHESLYLQILEKIYALNFVYKAFVYYILVPEIRKSFIKLLVKLCNIPRRRQNQDSTEL